MFGLASEITRRQFIFKNAQLNWVNKDDVYNVTNSFEYIMDKCLHNPKNGEKYQDAPLLHNMFTVHVNNQSKYEILKKVNANLFLSDKHKSEFMELFSRSQRIYFAINRLAFLWKYKKAVQGNTMDMMMNDIHREERGVVEVYQEGSIFLFRYT